MFLKVLISCALFVTSQARYAPKPVYAAHAEKPLVAGIAAQLQPAATLTVLPSPKLPCGSAYPEPAPGYHAAAPAYHAPAHAYPQAAHSHGAIHSLPASNHISRNPSELFDAEVMSLAKLVFDLPSPGGPNPVILNVPDYSNNSYSSHGVVLLKGSAGSNAGHASAAAATSNVKPAPAPAPAVVISAYQGSGYGPAPAPEPVHAPY